MAVSSLNLLYVNFFFCSPKFKFTSFACIIDILQTVFGVPSECVHHNKIRPCKLSFSCWLQGGKHVHGCGDNKWLFSCCVSEEDALLATASTAYASQVVYSTGGGGGGGVNGGVTGGGGSGGGGGIGLIQNIRKPLYTTAKDKSIRPASAKLKLKFAKKNILRRRTDDSNLSVRKPNL